MSSVKFGSLEIFSVDGEGDIEINIEGDYRYEYAFVKRDEFVAALEDLGIIPPQTKEKLGFFEAVERFLNDRGYSVSKVLDVKQETREGGYCDTCWYSETYVEITFLDGDGDQDSYDYYGDMGEFMRELTD